MSQAGKTPQSCMPWRHVKCDLKIPVGVNGKINIFLSLVRVSPSELKDKQGRGTNHELPTRAQQTIWIYTLVSPLLWVSLLTAINLQQGGALSLIFTKSCSNSC